MKALSLLTILVSLAFTANAQVTLPGSPATTTAPAASSAPEAPKSTNNYSIQVVWREAAGGTNTLRVVTGEGSVALNTLAGSIKTNNIIIPIPVRLDCTITELGNDKARLRLFLGRTIPIFGNSVDAQSSMHGQVSYSQQPVGLNSTFTVTLGKTLTVQSDNNGEISVLVEREEN
jgi:hypothetical protein